MHFKGDQGILFQYVPAINHHRLRLYAQTCSLQFAGQQMIELVQNVGESEGRKVQRHLCGHALTCSTTRFYQLLDRQNHKKTCAKIHKRVQLQNNYNINNMLEKFTSVCQTVCRFFDHIQRYKKILPHAPPTHGYVVWVPPKNFSQFFVKEFFDERVQTRQGNGARP